MSRQMTLVTLAILLACFPASASQPEGLAGKAIRNAMVADTVCYDPGFEWYEFMGVAELSADDTLALDLAIIPFGSGVTSVGLDEATFASTFVSLIFAEGSVNGLPYRRFGWNDVTAEIRLATQDYLLTVNGLRAGPFPLGGSCTEGCFSVQAFRVNGSQNDAGDVAWVDSISTSRRSAEGSELLFEYTAYPCSSPPTVSGGGLVIADPSERRGRGRCAGGAR